MFERQHLTTSALKSSKIMGIIPLCSVLPIKYITFAHLGGHLKYRTYMKSGELKTCFYWNPHGQIS